MTTLPPHSIEAERGVLGCIMLDPADTMSQCISALSGGECFYDLRHRTIWHQLASMVDTGIPIDVITLGQRLKDGGQLDGVGGLAYISTLPDATPSAFNLPNYLGIVKEKHTLRRLISTCANIATGATEYDGSVDNLLAQVEQDIFKCCQPEVQETTRKDSFMRLTHLMEDAMNNKGQVVGLESGLYAIDRILGGFRNSTMNVIAARPGLGKSTLGYGIAEHNAKKGIPVGYFSLEMSEDELNLRSLCSNSGVNSKLALTGNLSELDIVRMTQQVGVLGKLPIHINDRSDLTIQRIRSDARRMVAKSKVKLIVVDYLQLVTGVGRFGRREDVDDVSRGIKGMSKELNIPVIALAQLNREIEKDAGRRPRLADLRESGGIEQDADTVSFIYCPDETAIMDNGTLPVRFSTQKNRNGDVGECDLLFERALTRFTVPSIMS